VEQLITLQMLEFFNVKGEMPVYYLHPSFGYLYERFYYKPKGLVWQLIPYPQGVLDRPALTVDEVNENQQFWIRMGKDVLYNIPAQKEMLGGNSDATAVSFYCSQAVNCWGVELQKNSRLKEAAEMFALSLKLNTNNYMAKVNLNFNAALRVGNTQPINSSQEVRDALREYRTPEGILSILGTADEPDLHLKFGQAFATGGTLRQAYQLFQRRLVLRPNDFEALLALSKTFADMHRFDKAEEMITKTAAQASLDWQKTEVLRIRTFIDVLQNKWEPAEARLVEALKQTPEDISRVALVVEFYRMRGLNLIRSEKDDKPANEMFAKALSYSTRLLELLRKQGKSGSADESETLLKISQLQIQLNQFAEAIKSLDVLLQRQPDNKAGLLSRAIAEVESKNYTAAKRDYYTLLKLVPESVYAVYYGLTEVATKEKDHDAALKNCRLYLKYAPKTTPEYKKMQERLAELQR
jgi:tetratricopeptide (TPR) repeat protein